MLGLNALLVLWSVDIIFSVHVLVGILTDTTFEDIPLCFVADLPLYDESKHSKRSEGRCTTFLHIYFTVLLLLL